MDIRRILDGEKYYYIDSKSRKRIKNKRTVKRIQKLNIPPGYKKVKISSKNNSKVQSHNFYFTKKNSFNFKKSIFRVSKISKIRP